MSEIIPRWEWRVFARQPQRAAEAFARLTPTGVAESDETYFLSGPTANVKIRDELIDIKILREVDEDGLERWEPVLKRPFPLSSTDLATVLEALGIPNPGAGGRGHLVRDVPRDRRRRTERPDRAGPQATRPLHHRRLHGGTLRARGRRPHRHHDRRRGDRPAGRPGGRRDARPRGVPQHKLPDRPCASRRRGPGSFRRHRRRHELDQVPHRRVRRWTGRRTRSSTAPR